MLGTNDKEDVMSEQNKDLVRRYYGQLVNGRDLDAVGDYFADERMAAGVRKGCFFYFQAFPISTSLWTSLLQKGTVSSFARR
jgi:hypothetical protein